MSRESFGRYEVLGLVGDGSMARVYKAWDPAFERVVAVKTIKSEHLASDTAAEYLHRFGREGRAIGSLNHPSIVRVFDVGPDFLVMEFVRGRTLKQILREGGPFDAERTVRLLSPVAEAIDHAHRNGVVHRDVKPANIVVQPDGVPKLVDFGIAHVDSSVMTTAGEILGSPSYMPPEQLAGQPATATADVYALAVVAYEVLTGAPPFQGSITSVIYRVMHDACPNVRESNPALPGWYDEVFRVALDKDPARRFPDASAFVAALAEHRLQRAARPAPSRSERTAGAASPRVARHSRARRRRGVAIAISLAALCAAAWLLDRGVQTSAAQEARNAAPTSAAAQVAPATTMQAPAGTRTRIPPRAPQYPTRTERRASGASSRLERAARAARDRIAEPGSDVTPPRKIAGTTVLPSDRSRPNRNGTVGIRMVIDENGVPGDLVVVESAGPVLDAAALASVRSWRFEPARRNGVPVKIRWLARQTYRL